MLTSHATSTIDFDNAADLDALQQMLESVRMKNGWAKPTPSLYPEPKRPFIPAHWSYVEARAALHAAGRLVSTDKAERRNLIMANPVPDNDYATTRTMVGAYQMVMPGEYARSHRHTPNAMRVVLEGTSETYTIVDGKRIPMEPGDVLLTPNWCYHGHDNQSDKEAYWIDILDVPLTEYLGPIFFEAHPDRLENSDIIEPLSPMRFAAGDYKPKLRAAPEVQPGVRSLELGPPTFTTFDRVLFSLSKGAAWTLRRSTVNQVFVVIQGSGVSTTSTESFSWSAGDMIAVPSWHQHEHSASSDAILLRMSDQPLMRMLGWERWDKLS